MYGSLTIAEDVLNNFVEEYETLEILNEDFNFNELTEEENDN